MILTQEQVKRLKTHVEAICGKFEKNNCLGCPFGPSLDVDFPQACGISFASIQVLEDVYNRYFQE